MLIQGVQFRGGPKIQKVSNLQETFFGSTYGYPKYPYSISSLIGLNTFWYLASKVYVVIHSCTLRPFSTFHTSNQPKMVSALIVVSIDPNSCPANFEAKQPRVAVSDDLRAHKVYVVIY